MRFLFIDRILEVEPGRRILAAKSITMSDGYLARHYGPLPVMPPTILLETMAQVGGDLNLLTRGLDVQTFLMIVDGLHIRRLPHPGETLHIDLRMHRGHTEGATVTGEARVGSEVMATLDRITYVHRRSTDQIYIRRQRARMEALLACPLPPVSQGSVVQPSPVLQPLS
jgi:3-hydroxyacyl-[acyl-carrier-protein] dehydratase